jgi:ubiquinone/menaquinone biosynthesis C-methylase UbiE
MDLKNINSYWQELTQEDIGAGKHRRFVGGKWDLVGRLQFDFMVSRGLRPETKLLDVGCGCLRGGVHFVRYLHDANYYGIDINQSLLDAGRQELGAAGLGKKKVHLLRTDNFDASSFGVKFDFAISVSLITHLDANHILLCFLQMKRVMHENSSFFFTFFETPALDVAGGYQQEGGGPVTHLTRDPYHYTRDNVDYLAKTAGLRLIYRGNWNRPRNQKMLELKLA